MGSEQEVVAEEPVDNDPAFYVTQKYFNDIQRNDIVDITDEDKNRETKSEEVQGSLQ